MSLPIQPRPDISSDPTSGVSIVCTLPPLARIRRGAAVHEVIGRATSSWELETGVAFAFRNTDDEAQSLFDLVVAERECCGQFRYTIVFPALHEPIELRIEAVGSLVEPLKSLYLGLANTGMGMVSANANGLTTLVRRRGIASSLAALLVHLFSCVC